MDETLTSLKWSPKSDPVAIFDVQEVAVVVCCGMDLNITHPFSSVPFRLRNGTLWESNELAVRKKWHGVRGVRSSCRRVGEPNRANLPHPRTGLLDTERTKTLGRDFVTIHHSPEMAET